MSKVAVVAHADKDLGGGLEEPRKVLTARWFPDPGWDEASKSRAAPKSVRRAVAEGADLVLVWGGDGMVLDAP